MDETNGGTQGAVSSILGWAKQPFNAQGDLLNWVLFLGLVVIAVFMWNRVLGHIRGAV